LLTCDWCEQEIHGMQQTGYSIEAVPFRPLNITGKRAQADKPVIVLESHFHEQCRNWFSRAVWIMLKDHEPTDEELEFDHCAAQDQDTEDSGEEKRWEVAQRRNEERCALPKLEQDRKVLEALGDDRLTNTELGTRLDEGEGPCPYTNDSSVAIITRRLYKAGELERQEGQFGMSRVRYSRAKPNEALKKLDEQLTDGAVA
jgi:hypothetical protein